MRFLSVCSGIEAASVAWSPLGWRAIGFSEIEPFPSAVLKHHYPSVPNYGDMTTLAGRISSGEIEAPDLLCGGTPCQAFSVAGLRKSLDDARGNLTLTFCEIANAIDDVRRAAGQQPAIIFWENVPGVLNTKDNAFGCFLGELAGESCKLQPPGGRWKNAGLVLGPQRAVAWRVLDAQYFGVAQRRRRVFVVASARDGFNPAKVLFEFEGVRRDTAPSREAGKVAPAIPSRSTAGGGLGTDFDCDGGVVKQPYPVANCLTQRMHKGINTTLDEGQTPVLAQPIGFNARQDPDHWKDRTGPLDTNGSTAGGGLGTNFDLDGEVICAFAGTVESDVAATIQTTCHEYSRADGFNMVVHSLRGEGFDASKDGTGRGTPLVPVGVFQDSEFGVQQYDSAGTLRAGRIPEHQMVMQPVAFHPTQDPISSTEVCHSVGTGSSGGTATAVAFAATAPTLTVGHNGSAGHMHRQAGNETALVGQSMAVRRLTPTECERLQGFPDGYTNIPWRNKPESPDGPRYKALGNSWAVPVVAWIGRRIAIAAL